MSKLSFQDNIFLLFEEGVQKNHISGLYYLKKPKGAPRDFVADLCQQLRDSGPVDLGFRSKIKHDLHSLSQEWEEEEAFDIDYHIRHYALPFPGTDQKLMELVDVLHSQGLDMARPLWEFHMIDGLKGGRFAIFMKQHHSMIDGVGAKNLMALLFSSSPDPQEIVAPWVAITKFKKGKKKEEKSLFSVDGLLSKSKSMISGTGDVAEVLSRHYMNIFKGKFYKNMMLFAAPRTIFNTRLSSRRNALKASLPIADMKKICAKTDATINDIFLSVTGAALQQYLDELNELPKEPLVAMVPVSIKGKGDAGGNQVACINCQLGMRELEPLERLQAVSSAMTSEKHFFGSISKQVTQAYINLETISVLTPMMISMSKKVLTGPKVRPVNNLVISNVPGPSSALYLNGALLESSIPMSIVSHGGGINVTGVSYNGQLSVCVMVCPVAVPYAERIADYIQAHFKALLKAAS